MAMAPASVDGATGDAEPPGDAFDSKIVGDRFRSGLASRLAAVERFAEAELRRYESDLAFMARENERLSSLLAVQEGNDTGSKPTELEYNANGCDQTCRISESIEVLEDHKGEDTRKGSRQSVSSVFEDSPIVKEYKLYLKSCEGNRRVSSVFLLYRDHGIFQNIARSAWFENVALLLIIANALWIPVEMDLNDAMSLVDADIQFQIVENLFCVLFIIELAIRFLAFKVKWKCFTDGWFVFDFCMVLSMVLDTWILTLIVYTTGVDGPDGLRMVSFLRTARLLRVTRMARIARMVPELVMMMQGMFAGFRSVCTAAALLGSVTYVFAIVLRQLTDETDVGRQYFRHVPLSLYTLLGESMIPDNVSMLNLMWLQNWYSGVVFFVFLFITSLTIMNMLIGVICEVLHNTSLENKADTEMEKMAKKMKAILKGLDSNFDGRISKSELMNVLYCRDMIKLLQQVGVDVYALVEDTDGIFRGVDELDFDDFKDVLLSFRANANTTMRGITHLRKLLRKNFEVVHDRLNQLERNTEDRSSAAASLRGSDRASRQAAPAAPLSPKVGPKAPLSPKAGPTDPLSPRTPKSPKVYPTASL